MHLGLATLFSYRLAQKYPELGKTFSIAINDYGFGSAVADRSLDQRLPASCVSCSTPRNVEADIPAGLNAAELEQTAVSREIARVAGLIDQAIRGKTNQTKQLQASSGLLYDVFTTYDSDNLLLRQAVREVLERQLEASPRRRAVAPCVAVKHCSLTASGRRRSHSR